MNSDHSNMDIDPNIAKELFIEGAILVITGVPIGTEFGIDFCTYTSGERFRGIKMIPPGLHFVFCASQGQYGDAAPRVGFLHFFKPQEIVIREWDIQKEELRERKIDNPELEVKRIRENILELDCFLAPYDYRFMPKWNNCTDAVSEQISQRCNPKCGVVRTNLELDSCPDSERPRGKMVSHNYLNQNARIDENDLLPDLKPILGTVPQYTTLPERVPKGLSPSEISKQYMDCYSSINKLMSCFHNSDDLAGEIQLAFVLFLIGHSVESLTHWRKCLNLLSNSVTAIFEHKEFYMKYLEVLLYQLPHLPDEITVQNEHNTVYKDVRNLLLNASVVGLTVSANNLIKGLEKEMNWHFMGLLDEDPDDLPTIVDIESVV